MSFDIFRNFWSDKYNNGKFGEIKNLSDNYQKIKLTGLNKMDDATEKKYRSYIKSAKEEIISKNNMLKKCLDSSDYNILNYNISFTLEKPLITNGEEKFYIHENPIAKEKVFKVPMIRASSIKGKLRWVTSKQFLNKLDKEIKKKKEAFQYRTKLVRIFGNETDAMNAWINKGITNMENVDYNKQEIKEKFDNYLKKEGYIDKKIESRRGRLQLYPIFFEDIGLEVINPIDRKTGTSAKGPITMEKIPTCTEGVLKLLYYPFDIFGEDIINEQKEEDIKIIGDAIYDMLIKYGIGAKTSDGYGVANNLQIEANEAKISSKEMMKEELIDVWK